MASGPFAMSAASIYLTRLSIVSYAA